MEFRSGVTKQRSASVKSSGERTKLFSAASTGKAKKRSILLPEEIPDVSSGDETSSDDEIVRGRHSLSSKVPLNKKQARAKRAAVLGISDPVQESLLRVKDVSETKSSKLDLSEDENSDSDDEADNVLQLGPKSYVRFYGERRPDSKENAIGYIRVSTEHQEKEGTSIPGQILQIEDRCRQNKVNLMYICVDAGISGTKPRQKRPGLNYLYKTAKAKDIIMVVDGSRLTRDPEYSLRMRRRFKERRIRLDSFETAFGVNSADDDTIKNIMAVVHGAQVSQTSQKVSKAMRAKSDAGQLPTKPPYGWRYNGTGVERLVVEEEQKGLVFIRNLVKEQPELTIPEIVRILNDPKNNIAPFRRNPKPGQPGWYYTAVKRVLIREGLRAGKRFERLSTDEKADRAERVRVRDTEDTALLEEIKEICKADPGVSCRAVARELTKRGVKLGSERKVDHNLVQRILEGDGIQVSLYDPDAEKEAAEAIRKMREKDPKIKVAEIIRRMTSEGIPPLLRAKTWYHYTVKKLIEKYEIP